MFKKSVALKIALLVIVILIAARAALPWAMKTYANSVLDSIPGYYGSIEDIDVALWRGTYRVHDMKLLKINGDDREPFYAVKLTRISLDWRALAKGKLKSAIELHEPEVQFIRRESAAASQVGIDQTWQKKVQKLYPFEVNSFKIFKGLVRYRDLTTTPKMNFYFHEMDLTADNISNAEGSKERLPSNMKLSGKFLQSGTVNADAKINVLAEPFEADLNASIKQLDLKELNDFTKAYGAFDFEKGKLQVTTEFAATTKRFDGYVKTILRDVDVLDYSKERKEGDSVTKLLWEGLVGGAIELFENQRREQFAARIPLSGSRDEISIHSWATVGSILKNAFFKALDPKLEDSVAIAPAKAGQ